MTRTPPAEIRRILREEVGFGCPVPHCRKPFLTWHHFDPPWREKEHHNPEGMIALCTEHHPGADVKKWSVAKLKELKKSASSLSPVKARFSWVTGHHLIRLGGNYVVGTTVPVRAGGEDIIRITENPLAGLELSFILRDMNGRPIAEMIDNMFETDPQQIGDLKVDIGATNLKIKAKHSDVLLHLWFKRLSPEQLLEQLRLDMQAQLWESLRRAELWPEWRPHVDPESVRDTMKWAESRCLDDEGKIPVIDFHNMLIYSHSRKIEFKRGIRADNSGGIYSCIAQDITDVAFNL